MSAPVAHSWEMSLQELLAIMYPCLYHKLGLSVCVFVTEKQKSGPGILS